MLYNLFRNGDLIGTGLKPEDALTYRDELQKVYPEHYSFRPNLTPTLDAPGAEGIAGGKEE